MLIKVLVENDNVIKEHGLSLYFEYKNEKFLFDTAQSNLFIKNGHKMDVNFNDIKTVILSHGHYDHGNGLLYLGNKDLICHPDVFLKRYRPDGTYVGLNQTRSEINKKFNIIESKGIYYINEKICFLGEIKGRLTKYKLQNGDNDYIYDDSALVINDEKGLIIITGCSHSGIENIINYAKKIMKTDKVYSVIGGFHLKEVNENVKELVNTFKEIEYIYTGHCTDKTVIDYFIRQNLNVKKLKSLMEIEL
ncbi:MAG: MBL fold metallo-hydrolase [Bacillota bacterium]|nr:MBL fold metallo-hydrolase [Bacillota bacterium]